MYEKYFREDRFYRVYSLTEWLIDLLYHCASSWLTFLLKQDKKNSMKIPSKLESFARMYAVSSEEFHIEYSRTSVQFWLFLSIEIIFLFVHLVCGSAKVQLNLECYITEIDFALSGGDLVYFSTSFATSHMFARIMCHLSDSSSCIKISFITRSNFCSLY